MEAKKHSQEFLRKRKMLLFLPVIVIPLLSMVFYGMGGGKGTANDVATTAGSNGLNMNLPGAKFNKQDGKMDKLSAYKKADLDSARLKDELREDPYHAGSMPTTTGLPPITSLKGINPGRNEMGKGIATLSPQDTAAGAVLKRLEHLKQVLHQPPAVAPMPGQPNSIAASQGEAPDAARLDQLLSNLKASSTNSDTDPQLEKLNGMLDKILQIQHPGDIAAGKDTVQSPGRAAAFELQKSIDHPVVPDIGSTAVNNPGEKTFYTLDEPPTRDTMQANIIPAIVEGDQTLVSGGTIGMRLSDDAVLNGVPIPKNTLLYGMVSLSGERMNVMVNSIRHNNAIYPVTLQVYDMDGLPGIRIPGAISREVAKESADQAVSGIGITTLDPSLGAQAAGAGIQAAKTLFSRKVKLVRVSVPTGYQVFLKNIKK